MKIPEILTVKQLRKLFEVVDDPTYMVIYSLATFCGMRRASIATLLKDQVDLERGCILVRDDKNPNRGRDGYGKDRNVPIPTLLFPLLELWMEYNPNSKYMFPSPFRRSNHISVDALSKKIIVDLRRAGINNPTYVDKRGYKRHLYRFHTLRHSYATYYYERTGDAIGLKNNLGHATMGMVTRYTHMAVGKRRDMLDKAFSPTHKLLSEDYVEDADAKRHENRMKELQMELRIMELRSGKGAGQKDNS